MMTKRYDDEIRELELKLERERASLMEGADELADSARATADRARAAAVSPRGLLGAFATGFLFGELTRRRRGARRQQEAAVPRSIGVGSLLGGAALALIRAQYGSPLAFARAMWGHVDEWRHAHAAAASRAAAQPSYPPASEPYAPGRALRPGIVDPPPAGVRSPAPLSDSPLP